MLNFDNLCRPSPDRVLRRAALHSLTASSCLISFPIHPGATACAGNWSLPVNLGAATFPHYDRHEHIICFVQ